MVAVLDEDEKLIETNIGLLRDMIGDIGAFEYDEADEQHNNSHMEKPHTKERPAKKHNKGNAHNSTESDIQYEDDEENVVDILFPKLSKNVRTVIDIVAAVVILVIGMIILRL